MSYELTDAEKFFFENNGYLVLDNFLASSHIETLRSALAESIEMRRECEEKGLSQTGMTHIHGEKSTRIFYILGDHPAFLELSGLATDADVCHRVAESDATPSRIGCHC